jgi:hypothetical protein
LNYFVGCDTRDRRGEEDGDGVGYGQGEGDGEKGETEITEER